MGETMPRFDGTHNKPPTIPPSLSLTDLSTAKTHNNYHQNNNNAARQADTLVLHLSKAWRMARFCPHFRESITIEYYSSIARPSESNSGREA